jgi:hypothetical protein
MRVYMTMRDSVTASLAIVLALACCNSKDQPDVTPTQASTPSDAAIDATRATDAALDACSSQALGARGTRQEPRVVVGNGGDCWLRGTGRDEYLSDEMIAKLLGRPLDSRDATTFSFEIADRKRFDAAVRCRGGAPTINFRRDHVWMVVVRGEGIHTNAPTVFDDGTDTSLVVGWDRSCGGADFGYAVFANGVLVPAVRKVTVVGCPSAHHCSGMEK